MAAVFDINRVCISPAVYMEIGMICIQSACFGIATQNQIVQKQWLIFTDPVDISFFYIASYTVIQKKCVAVGTPAYREIALVSFHQATVAITAVYKEQLSITF